MYMPPPEGVAGEKAIEPSASDVGFYEGAGIELNDVLREVVLLALPMRWMCQDDCKGICPSCGRNRNERLHLPTIRRLTTAGISYEAFGSRLARENEDRRTRTAWSQTEIKKVDTNYA